MSEDNDHGRLFALSKYQSQNKDLFQLRSCSLCSRMSMSCLRTRACPQPPILRPRNAAAPPPNCPSSSSVSCGRTCMHQHKSTFLASCHTSKQERMQISKTVRAPELRVERAASRYIYSASLCEGASSIGTGSKSTC